MKLCTMELLGSSFGLRATIGVLFFWFNIFFPQPVVRKKNAIILCEKKTPTNVIKTLLNLVLLFVLGKYESCSFFLQVFGHLIFGSVRKVVKRSSTSPSVDNVAKRNSPS